MDEQFRQDVIHHLTSTGVDRITAGLTTQLHAPMIALCQQAGLNARLSAWFAEFANWYSGTHHGAYVTAHPQPHIVEVE